MEKNSFAQKLKQKLEVDVVLMLIKSNRKFTPYYLRKEEEKVEITSVFNHVEPEKQKEVVEGIKKHYQRVCLNHPGDVGYLEIYNERLQCLKSYVLVEKEYGKKGCVTEVSEASKKGRHREVLKKSSAGLEKQISKIKNSL